MSEQPDYTEKLGRLDHIRLKGVHAENTRRELQPVIDQLRQIYLEDLIAKTREQGVPDDFNVFRLVVLDDVDKLLGEQVGRGAAAARKLTKLTNAGGSDA